MIQLRPQDITPHSEQSPLPVSALRAADTRLTAAAVPPHPPAAAVFSSIPSSSEAVGQVFSSRGLSDVLQERLRQVEQFGHTPDADKAVPLPQFQVVTMRLAHSITGSAAALSDRAKLRRKLVQLAAFCLAFIDRIDGQTSETPQ